jgi:ABC-type sulfate/molybdate transport systems ATPase subunit
LLVTHDFEDAAALAGRVGVIVEGRVLQLGTVQELVEAPVDPFVASFTGGNLMHGEARPGPNGLTEVRLEDGTVLFSADEAAGHVGLVVYPWEVSLSRGSVDGSALNSLAGEITSLVLLGNRVRVRVGPLVAEVTAESAEHLALARGETVIATFKATATRLVPLA